MLLNFITWNVDPAFLHLGPISIDSYFILLAIFAIYGLVFGYRYFFQKKKNIVKSSNNKKAGITLNTKDYKLIRSSDQYFAYAVGLYLLLRSFGLLSEFLNIDITIRWYGLMWALGIYATLLITTKIFKHEKLQEAWVDKLFIYTVLGAIIGARLGHCFFYEWKLMSEPVSFLGITFKYSNYYLLHPWELLYIWHGGLASHGGAIGILVAMILFNKNVSKKGINWIFDRLLIGVCLCGASIRFGNLMNSEIYGNVTSLPWGFIFVRDGQTQAMHPTQIYEMIYCLVTFAIMWWMYWKKEAYKRNGLLFGVFLVGVFGSRFFLEFIKLNQEAFESNMALNMGQWLSLPFFLWGILLLFRSNKIALNKN